MQKKLNVLLHRVKRNRIGALGGILALTILAIALLAPVIAPHDPNEMFIMNRMEAPSSLHPMGTDRFGRDGLSRVLYGTRVSLWVGITSVGIGVAGGLVFGLISGYYGGSWDYVIMRLMDVLFAFPSILLALVVIALLGPSLVNTMIAIGITYIPIFTRIVRASVLSAREQDYVQAAITLGIKDSRLLRVHILPNILAPIIVQASVALSGAILTEATLSFLGLGIQPPTASWGSMLSESRRYMELAPWTTIFPALAIMVTVLSFNLFGDGLRDALDPRLRNR